MKKLLVLMIVFVLAGCSASSNESAERLTEEAVTLTSPAADNAELRHSLDLLEKAIDLNESYVPAKKQRVRVLIRLSKFNETAEEARSIADLTGSPQDYFFYCMAKEVSDREYAGRDDCYLEAGRRYESLLDEPATDVNYVLTLKLAGSDRFDLAVDQFLGNLSADASRELFEPLLRQSGREQIISDIFLSNY